MRRSTHTTSRLKLVMLFDGRNQTCCVCSHNLDAEDASQEVAETASRWPPGIHGRSTLAAYRGRSRRMRCLSGGHQAVDQSAADF